MNGLYFYKLVSPYQEDVTKDCKLTINEIDNNFLNLKSNEISNAHIDEDEKKIYLTRNNGEDLILDLAKVTENPAFDVNYDSADGVIEIKNDGETYSIKDLITKDNLSKEILTKVYSDSTLSGVGTAASPLKLSSIQKTGHYKAAIKVLDSTINEHLPKKGNAKGDRYVTLEEVNEFGLLYNFDAVRHINQLLQKTGWRVATKADWDNMLNAIEPCEYRDHASTLNNRVLGHVAGSLLKATHDWRTAGILDDMNKPCQCPKSDIFDPYEIEEICEKVKYPKHPEKKKYPSEGKDAYGMGILPGGYAYYSKPMQYNQFGFQGAYWTTDMMYDTDVYTKVFESNESGVLQLGERPSAFLSIRLVKDYDGTNDYGIENILGDNYKTVLMPSLNNPNGYAVWTAQNFRLREARLESTIPNAGLGVRREKVYFINEWNGFGWNKLQMEEGDSIVIIKGREWNELYRIIEGKLVNTTKHIIDTIRKDLKSHLDLINSRIFETEHAVNDIECGRKKDKCHHDKEQVGQASILKRLMFLEEDLEALNWKHKEDIKMLLCKISDLGLLNEKELKNLERLVNEKFKELENVISELNDSFKSKTEEIESKIDSSISDLENKIKNEIERAKDVEEELQNKIISESSIREEADKELESKINDESERAQNSEKELQDSIEKETKEREEKDTELENKISNLEEETKELDKIVSEEIQRAEKVEKTLDDNLNQEIEDRKKADEKLQLGIDTVDGNTLIQEGTEYDETSGVLTLKTKNGSELNIKFGFNFGTF